MTDGKVYIEKVASFPLMGMLGILFVGLKLTGHIDWSWWWVTVPFWGPVALFLAMMGGLLLFGLIALVIAALLGR